MLMEVDRVELLGEPIVRVAAWPLETLQDFAAPDLASQADALLDLAGVIEASRISLCDRLFDVIPEPMPRQARRQLLRLRRRLYNGIDPVPTGDDALAHLRSRTGLYEHLCRHLDDRVRLQNEQARFNRAWALSFNEEC